MFTLIEALIAYSFAISSILIFTIMMIIVYFKTRTSPAVQTAEQKPIFGLDGRIEDPNDQFNGRSLRIVNNGIIEEIPGVEYAMQPFNR